MDPCGLPKEEKRKRDMQPSKETLQKTGKSYVISDREELMLSKASLYVNSQGQGVFQKMQGKLYSVWGEKKKKDTSHMPSKNDKISQLELAGLQTTSNLKTGSWEGG